MSVKSRLRSACSNILPVQFASRLRKSRPAFYRARTRYFQRHPVYINRDASDPALAELLANGIVVLPSYFSRPVMERLHPIALSAAERVRHGTAPKEWDTVVYPDDGIYRIRNVGGLLPEALPIVADERLLAIARTYLGFPVRSMTNYLDYKPDFGRHDDTTVPHMDSWMSQVKIFTLLNDIDALSAPMVYWKRSHLDAPWRRDFDYHHFSESYFGSSGICPPHVLRDRANEADIQSVTVTGPAGTVAIADVRGFHRASNVFRGYRLEIVQKITIQIN